MSVYDVKNPIATTTGQTTTTLFNPFTTIPYTIPITTNYSIPTTTQYTISTSPSNLSNALTNSYNTINTSRFNILDNQDRLNSLEKRIHKIKTDLASLNTSKQTTSSSSFIFY